MHHSIRTRAAALLVLVCASTMALADVPKLSLQKELPPIARACLQQLQTGKGFEARLAQMGYKKDWTGAFSKSEIPKHAFQSKRTLTAKQGKRHCTLSFGFAKRDEFPLVANTLRAAIKKAGFRQVQPADNKRRRYEMYSNGKIVVSYGVYFRKVAGMPRITSVIEIVQ